jgi:hypothetical protein
MPGAGLSIDNNGRLTGLLEWRDVTAIAQLTPAFTPLLITAAGADGHFDGGTGVAIAQTNLNQDFGVFDVQPNAGLTPNQLQHMNPIGFIHFSGGMEGVVSGSGQVTQGDYLVVAPLTTTGSAIPNFAIDLFINLL